MVTSKSILNVRSIKELENILLLRSNMITLFVGLLELENKPSSASSTWVLTSNRQIQDSDFNKFINLYCKDDMNPIEIKQSYSNTNPKFDRKNHERNQNLEDKQLGMWYIGLLSKIN